MKRKKYFFGIFFLLILNYLTATDVLIVMVPLHSSNEMQIVDALLQQLKERTKVTDAQWDLIDLTKVRDELKDTSQDFTYLSDAVNKFLDLGKSVIVYTDRYSEKFELQFHSEHVKKIKISYLENELHILYDFKIEDSINLEQGTDFCAFLILMEIYPELTR